MGLLRQLLLHAVDTDESCFRIRGVVHFHVCAGIVRSAQPWWLLFLCRRETERVW